MVQPTLRNPCALPSMDGALILDPVAVVALQILTAEYCEGDTYLPERCEPWCSLCRQALETGKVGHA